MACNIRNSRQKGENRNRSLACHLCPFYFSRSVLFTCRS